VLDFEHKKTLTIFTSKGQKQIMCMKSV